MRYDLYTLEGERVPDTPWPDYPRPQLRRDSFFNLNGLWEFAVPPDGCSPVYDRTIRVPFCPESLLSGVHRHFAEGSRLFYRRFFSLPEGFVRDRVLLHIGAADQVLDCFVNGRHVGGHTGGYTSMTFDITAALDRRNELVVQVQDDLRSPALPYGKQVQKPGGMWYTPVSGIWQTVWLESVPACYVRGLDIRADDRQAVIDTGDETLRGEVTVRTPDGEMTCPLEKGRAVVRPARPRQWSPRDPYLYFFTLKTESDRVESYFALRRLDVRQIHGAARLCLNGKPLFFHGVLDQGYYSDGLYTPAAPRCYEQDIRTMQRLGFNTLRKHIKIEPEIFYYQCDRLGMVVFQDMVNNGDYRFVRDTLLPTLGFRRKRDVRLHRDPAARAAFLEGMEATVAQLKNHPCIFLWTVFNEGWGQFDSARVYARLKELDPDRFVDTASGWFLPAATDVDSRHIYFGPWRLRPGDNPLLLTEFGGACLAVEGHLYHPDKSYGYSTCKDRAALEQRLRALYEKRVLPAARKGLCGAIYTQLSDVEDEINGLVTWDRRVVKVEPDFLRELARRLEEAVDR